MRQQVTAHSHEIVGGEADFREPIFESRIFCLSRRSFQQDPLVRRGHEITRLRTGVLRTMGGESKNFGIELAGFRDVTNVDSDVIDAEDARALRRLLAAQGKPSGLQKHAEGDKSGGVLQSAGKFGKTLHDLRDYISQVEEGAVRLSWSSLRATPPRSNTL
jgi:hypothetical protein